MSSRAGCASRSSLTMPFGAPARPAEIDTPSHEYARPPAFDFGFVAGGRSPRPGRARHRHGRRRAGGTGSSGREVPGTRSTTATGRASVPFALMEKNANCMHQGVLTFATAATRKIAHRLPGVAGNLPVFPVQRVGYALPSTVDASIDRACEYSQLSKREVSRRLPVKPIELLANDYPGLDPASFGSVEDIAPATCPSMECSSAEFIQRWLRDAPWPLSLLRRDAVAVVFAREDRDGGIRADAAEAVHPGARKLLVIDYVPSAARRAAGQRHLREPARHGDRAIRLGGDGRRRGCVEHEPFLPQHDARRRDPDLLHGLIHARTAGKRWVYHTSDTYILGAALFRLVAEGEGTRRQFFPRSPRRARVPSARPQPRNRDERRTLDDVSQPFTGWGLVLQAR